MYRLGAPTVSRDNSEAHKINITSFLYTVQRKQTGEGLDLRKKGIRIEMLTSYTGEVGRELL